MFDLSVGGGIHIVGLRDLQRCPGKLRGKQVSGVVVKLEA